jgi:hypothetical protein
MHQGTVGLPVPGPVPFHADRVDRAERLCPGRQLRIATGSGRETPGPQQPRCRVEHRSYMHIGVSDHAHRHNISVSNTSSTLLR